MNNEILNVNHLYYEVDKQVIFRDFNLSVHQGEIVSIIGANKCGKSTLIKLLGGFYLTENMITVNNITLNEKSKEGFLKKVGFVYKDSSDSKEKVKDYIDSGLKKKDSNFYNKIIAMLGIKSLFDKRLDELNTDDFVLVDMCKNLVKKPNVLFIDYTNLSISKAVKIQINNLYRLLAKEDIAIVFATNDSSDILISDTTYVIHKGVIALSGKTKEVLKEDSLLLKLGIELPFEVDLSLKLGMYGLIDDIYYDVDELVNKLWK